MEQPQPISRGKELDFDDVMIRPCDSDINSRFNVRITKPYRFRWSPKIIEGNPAIAANMATTGTFEMAKKLQKHRMFTALNKHYTAAQLIAFLEENKKTCLHSEECRQAHSFVTYIILKVHLLF